METFDRPVRSVYTVTPSHVRLSTVLSDQSLHRDSMPCDETFDRPASAVCSVTASRVRLLTVRQISLSRE